MKVIIVGCGRMGIELLDTLSQKGHQIVAIDQNTSVFDSMKSYRNVIYKVGVGFDKDVLESSDIMHADALVACTNSDEVNAVVARVAKNIYGVPNVIARLYNAKNASIYTMLGIQTISTTEWGTRRVIKLLERTDMDSIATIGSSDVEIVKVQVPELLVGKNVQTVNSIGVQVVSILRDNKAFIPETGSLLQRNDAMYIAVENRDIERLHTVLGL